ncbi:MAG: type II toxin-antitoxin system PemK/MazF family toxin [Acidobacteriia bacterium]|nr:type II toxin-antitoxin system PemK/MazF family toxin [Terriglobia bacterium]
MGRTRKVASPRRGDVFVVDFDPTIGAEIRKRRPALVIQNDIDNRHSPVTIVAAITSQVDVALYPTEVQVRPPEGGLSKPSLVLLNQIRSIDARRLVQRLGRVRPETMRRVDRALKIGLGLVGV